MKRLFWLLLATATHTHAQKESPSVFCHVQGAGTDTVFVFYWALKDNDQIQRDTIMAHDDSFRYTPKGNDAMDIVFMAKGLMTAFPSGRLYLPDTRLINIIAKPGERLLVTGTLDEGYLHYQVDGSSISAVFARERESYRKWEEAIEKAESERALLPRDENLHVRDSTLMQERVAAQVGRGTVMRDYIRLHPDSDLSAWFLLGMSADTVLYYLPRLDMTVRNGLFRESLIRLEQRCRSQLATTEISKKMIEGSPAPAIRCRDSRGKIFDLGAIHSRYTVLDFWGSWCGWCIQEMPRLKQYRKKYGDAIVWVGIACNDEEAAWKNAIEKNGLDWTQLMSGDGNEIRVRYGIAAFPTKVIVDGRGKVVKIVVGGGDEFYEFMDRLLSAPASK